MKSNTVRLIALSTAALFFSLACNKDNSTGSNPNIPAGKSRVSVYLSDGPVSFYKVLIDIRQVVIAVDTAMNQTDSDRDDEWDDGYFGRHRDEEHKSVIWDTLSITPGVYDLLKLRNGTDTLLGAGIYPKGKVLKVRITLGSDNTIYTDSATSYPLEVFGFHPYFDINIRRENVYSVSNNEFKLWLDFNLEKSIFFWSGTYYLKPWVVAFNDQTSSKIKGLVLPEGASPLVEAFNATDTIYAVPEDEGRYMMRGVNPGTYSIFFRGHLGYQDTTINSIIVTSGQTTNAPTITLHK